MRAAEIEKANSQGQTTAQAELRRLNERSEVLQYELEARRDETITIAQELEDAKAGAEEAERQRNAEEKVNAVLVTRSG